MGSENTTLSNNLSQHTGYHTPADMVDHRNQEILPLCRIGKFKNPFHIICDLNLGSIKSILYSLKIHHQCAEYSQRSFFPRVYNCWQDPSSVGIQTDYSSLFTAQSRLYDSEHPELTFYTLSMCSCDRRLGRPKTENQMVVNTKFWDFTWLRNRRVAFRVFIQSSFYYYTRVLVIDDDLISTKTSWYETSRTDVHISQQPRCTCNAQLSKNFNNRMTVDIQGSIIALHL